jgi:hypothetical protein
VDRWEQTGDHWAICVNPENNQDWETIGRYVLTQKIIRIVISALNNRTNQQPWRYICRSLQRCFMEKISCLGEFRQKPCSAFLLQRWKLILGGDPDDMIHVPGFRGEGPGVLEPNEMSQINDASLYD